MKTAVLILALVAVASATPEISSWLQEERASGHFTGADEPELQKFMDFANSYKKSYSSKVHMMERLTIFRDNLKKIEFYNRMNDGAEYGATEFADLTEPEFLSRFAGLNGAAEAKSYAASLPTAEELPTGDLPKSFDWREKGAVTPVKNQGQCGSCWAFATVGDVEATNFLKTNKLTSLSESNLVDCDKATGNQGCQGGLPLNAYKYIAKAGIMTEEDYPYKAVDGTCKFDADKAIAKIAGGEQISTDEDQIAAYLVKNGPLAIGINASWMQFYFGGVSNPLFCSPKNLDHGVLIVGFGEDKGKKYWIIKNSWGASWGEKGYYRIIRGKGKCGVNQMVTKSHF